MKCKKVRFQNPYIEKKMKCKEVRFQNPYIEKKMKCKEVSFQNPYIEKKKSNVKKLPYISLFFQSKNFETLHFMCFQCTFYLFFSM